MLTINKKNIREKYNGVEYIKSDIDNNDIAVNILFVKPLEYIKKQ
ncbi:MAG: hypothetical protein ACOCRX_11780 [Candidatus Woesearchaeota archaeon]